VGKANRNTGDKLEFDQLKIGFLIQIEYLWVATKLYQSNFWENTNFLVRTG